VATPAGSSAAPDAAVEKEVEKVEVGGGFGSSSPLSLSSSLVLDLEGGAVVVAKDNNDSIDEHRIFCVKFIFLYRLGNNVYICTCIYSV
jgi:hypothetical protein